MNKFKNTIVGRLWPKGDILNNTNTNCEFSVSRKFRFYKSHKFKISESK